MSADIDIDTFDRDKILEHFEYINASRIQDGEFKKHNSGVYVTQIPHNPFNNLSTIPFKEANDRGYIKIDLLNVSIYEGVRDEGHLVKLMSDEPIWELLDNEEFCNKLFHINGHHNLVARMQPRNVEHLAAVLAIIRPSKKHLAGKNWEEVLQEVWIKPTDDAYYFKKAHAISYAFAIIVQMNLICENLLNDTE